MNIRPETPTDISAIETVNKRAFRDRQEEAGLVAAIRNSDSFLSDLSLVAELDGKVVGHIMFSTIKIETAGRDIPAVALAPMAVLPEFQGQGIGSALVRAGLRAARESGHAIVIVLGHPAYYPRFGFTAEQARPLECPYGEVGDAWMALELIPGALDGVRGKVVYPSFFEGV